jgi:MFS family permease
LPHFPIPPAGGSSCLRPPRIACLGAAVGLPGRFGHAAELYRPAVALPALREALGGSPLALNWVTNAFMLSFGATLMAAGALADIYGRRRVFLAGWP